MIKIHTKTPMNPESKVTPIFKTTFPNLSNRPEPLSNCFGSMTLKINKYPSKLIQIKKSQLEKQTQIFQWRQKTDFPIVKIRSWKLFTEKQTHQGNFLQILIQLESELKSLEDCNRVPFFQAIYILKESLIGFQRLYHRFGSFLLSPELIRFNETNNCKVWVNDECFSNQVNLPNKMTQKQFINDLCKIIKFRTTKSKNSVDFFQKIQTCKYFFQAIGAIDSFARSNKIKIPNSLQNYDEGKSPLLKTSLNMEMLLRQNKNKNLVTSSKIPAFIRKFQVKKKISTETYTPMPRKMTMLTDACFLDRSLTNISRNLSSNSFLKNQKEILKNENQVIDEDNFLKDLNIRLIEPSPQKNGNMHITSIQNISGWGLNHQYTPQSPVSPLSPYGRVSQLESNQDKKSGISFNKCTSNSYFSPFENAQKMFLTVVKPKKSFGTYSSKSPNVMNSAKKNKKLQDMGSNQQSMEDFEPINIDEPIIQEKGTGLFPSRERRKSDDYGNSSSRTEQEISFRDIIKGQNFQSQFNSSNVLKVPGNNRKQGEQLYKSPSHQVFKNRQRCVDIVSQQKKAKEGQFLRQTIMSSNGWIGLNILSAVDNIKESFIDDQQILILNQAKTHELPKLGQMGRNIKSSMISECEFQIEFADKIQKQKQIRNQLLELLN